MGAEVPGKGQESAEDCSPAGPANSLHFPTQKFPHFCPSPECRVGESS